MTSKLFLAGFVGMLALALFGSLLYGILFSGLFEANLRFADVVMKDPPNLAWIGLAHIPFGILLTLVISWRGATSMQSGAVTGALLGLLMAAS
jgi:hypothetical protein